MKLVILPKPDRAPARKPERVAMNARLLACLALALAACGARKVNGPAGTEGRMLTGEYMPEFSTFEREAWVGPAVHLSAQRGKVVLVEFWTFG